MDTHPVGKKSTQLPFWIVRYEWECVVNGGVGVWWPMALRGGYRVCARSVRWVRADSFGFPSYPGLFAMLLVVGFLQLAS